MVPASFWSPSNHSRLFVSVHTLVTVTRALTYSMRKLGFFSSCTGRGCSPPLKDLKDFQSTDRLYGLAFFINVDYQKIQSVHVTHWYRWIGSRLQRVSGNVRNEGSHSDANTSEYGDPVRCNDASAGRHLQKHSRGLRAALLHHPSLLHILFIRIFFPPQIEGHCYLEFS